MYHWGKWVNGYSYAKNTCSSIAGKNLWWHFKTNQTSG